MIRHSSYDMMHVTIWFAAVFCAVYVGILFYYFLMPIAHWVTWKDVYPEKDIIVAGTAPIIFISSIEQHRVTNYKFLDTLFCKKEGETKFLRHSQQSQENYAEGPSDKLIYRFPYRHTVKDPGVCFLKSTMLITSPFGTIKASKINGMERGHTFTVVEN